MAERFGKEGCTGMRRPKRGPLWGVFCYRSDASLFYSIDMQSQTKKKAKSQKWGGKWGRRPYFLPLVSPT